MSGWVAENRYGWMRWALCGALVLAAHGGAAALLANVSEPMPAGEPTQAIMLELSPIEAAPNAERTDLAVGPRQDQSEPEPKPVEKVEKEPDPKVEDLPPPPQPAAVVLPEPEPPKPEPPKSEPEQKVTIATAPEAADRVDPRAAAQMLSWQGLIVAQLNRSKSYPAGARDRREEGTTLLRFTINRQGQLVESSIARSSGHAQLDREAQDILKRAQPFPPPPAEVAGEQFSFTAPLRYYLR